MSEGNALTVGSLFSGIGGLELGLERAGMQVVWQVEKDPYCQKVLAKHWPNVERFDDVREVGSHNLRAVDLICGGFPCQDVSLAGKRSGLQGERTTLWREFARIICELRPRWVLAENVPGLLSSDSGMFFGQVLRDLAESGYDAEWQVLPAAAFGAPHKRDRVFIVAYAQRGGQQQQAEQAVSCGARGAARLEAKASGDGQFERRASADVAHAGRVSSERRRGAGDMVGAAGTAESEAHERERMWNSADDGSTDVADANCESPRRASESRGECGQWTIEPRVCRVPDELSTGVDGFDGIAEREPRVFGCSPQGRESSQQSEREPDDVVRFLSHEMALDTWQEALHNAGYLQDMRSAFEEIGYVPEALSALPQIWRSLSDEEKAWVGLRLGTGSPWCAEWPGIPRVATGVKNRVDRLRCLGNAVVPQVAEWIGRQIVRAHYDRREP